MSVKKKKDISHILVRELQKRSDKCQALVRSTFRSEKIEYPPLKKALEHYFSYWNDFTHPGLFSIAYEASGGNVEEGLKAQAAIAMIAAGFDIHDDIIDRSVKKQHQSTVFGKFGQDLALLLGDAFMINGLTRLELATVNLPGAISESIFETIKKCLFEVGNAHALELSLRRSTSVSGTEFLKILEMKAASIEADMYIAALIASGKSEESEMLRRFGRILGILATLREEFIDIFDLSELRRRRQDETLPIPIVLAMQSPQVKTKILEKIRKKKLTQNDLDSLQDLVFTSDEVNMLKRKMESFCAEALRLADGIKNEKNRNLLKTVAKSTLEDL